MSTTHAIPDTLYEIEAIWADLGPAVIVSHTGLTVPASSLTLPAVAANGYVLAPGPPARLVYVSQPAISLTLSGGNGTFWLALHTDLSTAVAGWTRRAGSHYLWQMNATQPANPPSGFLFCQLIVAGGVITTVTPLPTRTSQPMSKQNSAAVVITGGIAGFTGNVSSLERAGNNQYGFLTTLEAAGGTDRWAFLGTGNAISRFGGPVQIVGPTTCGGPGLVPRPDVKVEIQQLKNTEIGLLIKAVDNNTGAYATQMFTNVAGTVVGTITTTASATAYNTTSDGRLKEGFRALQGALARVQALRPGTFRWKADGTPGVGFVAQEAQAVVPEAVTGQDGDARPMQMDASKLIPYLVGAVKELAQQVETLTARLAAWEA